MKRRLPWKATGGGGGFTGNHERESVGLAEKVGGDATRAVAAAELIAYIGNCYNRRLLRNAPGFQSPLDLELRPH